MGPIFQLGASVCGNVGTGILELLKPLIYISLRCSHFCFHCSHTYDNVSMAVRRMATSRGDSAPTRIRLV